MTILTQGVQPLEFVLSEANGQQSRDTVTVTIAGAVALVTGQLLGKITASGKYVKHNSGASDGSQTAVAVLGADLPGVNGDYKALAITRNAEVITAMLNNQVAPAAQALADLKTVGIIAR
mgnify:CR=1 FL=1